VEIVCLKNHRSELFIGKKPIKLEFPLEAVRFLESLVICGGGIMTQNKYLLATASGVAVAAAAGGAQAADMAVKARPPVPVAAPTWAGLYIGASAGAAWERMSDDPVSPYSTFVVGNGAPTSVRGTAFIGGAEIGYNWQNGNIVYGLEADISGLGGGFTNVLGPTVPSDGAGSSSRIKWLDTVRGRLGITLGNDSLAYVTGGLAVGGVNNSFNFGDPPAPAFMNNKSVSKTQVGWTVGGGLQHMITPHWIVGIEALYVDLGKSSVSYNIQAPKTTSFRNTAAITRVKLDYKF
jgi:outer membrane immunogenic protein